MDAHNLATVITPNILCADPSKGAGVDDSFLAIEAVHMLIIYNDQMCEVSALPWMLYIGSKPLLTIPRFPKILYRLPMTQVSLITHPKSPPRKSSSAMENLQIQEMSTRSRLTFNLSATTRAMETLAPGLPSLPASTPTKPLPGKKNPQSVTSKAMAVSALRRTLAATKIRHHNTATNSRTRTALITVEPEVPRAQEATKAPIATATANQDGAKTTAAPKAPWVSPAPAEALFHDIEANEFTPAPYLSP